MTIDELAEEVAKQQDEGNGWMNVVIPCQTGGEYSPDSMYEFDGDVKLN